MSLLDRNSRILPPPSTTLKRVSRYVSEKHGRVLVDPDKNVLVGLNTIRKYLGLRSMRALQILRSEQGLDFYIFLRYDGRWMTSCTLLDHWLFLASRAQEENRRVKRARK